jgi:hypothetical protein
MNRSMRPIDAPDRCAAEAAVDSTAQTFSYFRYPQARKGDTVDT